MEITVKTESASLLTDAEKVRIWKVYVQTAAGQKQLESDLRKVQGLRSAGGEA